MPDLSLVRHPFKVFKADFELSASGLIQFTLPDGTKTNYLDIGDVDWNHITIDQDVTAATGTTPTLDTKLKTVVAPGGTAPGDTTLNAKDAGGTAFAMTQATAAGREVKTLGKSTYQGHSTIGRYIAIYGKVGGTTPSFTGSISIFVGR